MNGAARNAASDIKPIAARQPGSVASSTRAVGDASPYALGDRRRVVRHPHQHHGHDDGAERQCVDGERPLVAPQRDRAGGERRADDPTEIPLRGGERSGRKQVFRGHQVGKQGLVERQPKATSQPPMATMPVTSPGVARPLITSSASDPATVASRMLATMRNSRRFSRSANAPPIGDSRPCGKKPATNASAAHARWCVCAATYEPTATVCIHDPVFEIIPDVHTNA